MFLTTREVADLTMLSIGTVQHMVDEGEFKYFLTRGGHRRISFTSVKVYLVKRNKQLKGKK